MKKNYIYKELEAITSTFQNKTNVLLAKIEMLLAYAYDMCNSANDNELENMSELVIGDAFSKAIAFRYAYEKQQTYNKSLDDVKSMLVKAIGSYIMVCFYNWFSNTTNLNVEFVQKQSSIELTDLVLKVGNEILDCFEITRKMIENDLDFSSEESLDMNFENFCEELIAFQNNVDKSIETKTYRCITEEAKTIYLANYEEVKNNCELITEEIKLVNNTEESKKFASVIKEYIARILEAANNKVYGSDEQIVMRSEKDEIGLFEIKLHIDDNSYEKDFRNNRFSTVISYKTANSLKEEYEKINNIIAEIENAKNINIYLDYEIEGNIKNYSLKHFIKYLDNTLENNLVYKVNNYNLDLEMGDVYCYNKFEKDLFNNFVKREWFVTNTSNKEYAISDWDLRNVIFNLKNTPEIVSKQVENQIKTYLDTMRNLHTLTGFESVIKKLLLILNNNKLELNNLTLQLLSKSTYSQTEYSYDFGTDNIVYNIRSAFYDGYTKEAKEIKENKISKVQMDNENAITIGRNDLCSCGSGKKYKKCCGKNN